MSQTLDNLLRKHAKTQNHVNTSVRTLKSYSNYNISQFLPNGSKQLSQNMNKASTLQKSRDKVSTEVVDRKDERRRQAEINQLIRKNQLLHQEKIVIKAELECSKKDAQALRQNLQKKQQKISELQFKLKPFQEKRQKKRENQLNLDRNTIQNQFIPKFKQCYQVSVQTDTTFDLPDKKNTIQGQNYNVQKESKGNRFSADNEMEHIYQKLQNLKMNKKVHPDKKPTFNKTERGRMHSQTWNNPDKQNNMRSSNIQEKRHQTNKYFHPREQTIELHCLPLEIGEKMLENYLDQPFVY